MSEWEQFVAMCAEGGWDFDAMYADDDEDTFALFVHRHTHKEIEVYLARGDWREWLAAGTAPTPF